MRKFLTSCIDNKTHKEIVYSELSEAEAYWEIESKIGIEDAKIVNNIIEIITRKRKFYYDIDRRLLLGD